jgi:hypothetical protein
MVSPPLTLSTWPVTNEAASEQKNSTAAATSSGRASRRNGMALISDSRSLSGSEANSGVSVGPGRRS